jgi:hypothetical protein
MSDIIRTPETAPRTPEDLTAANAVRCCRCAGPIERRADDAQWTHVRRDGQDHPAEPDDD